MKTEWTITEDAVAEDGSEPGTYGNAVGVTGPGDATLTAEQIISHPQAKRFRMYDDDHTFCYAGYLVGDDEFAPLDDFGEPNAGCTGIEILENGEWHWL